ncbi:MAG: hypothetical protein ACFN9G_12165 [Cardiobacterium sp.]
MGQAPPYDSAAYTHPRKPDSVTHENPFTAALRLAAFAAVTFAAVSIAWFAAKSRIETQSP